MVNGELRDFVFADIRQMTLVDGRVVVYGAPSAKSVAVAPLVDGRRRGVRVSVRF